jgi:hypothetical protein
VPHGNDDGLGLKTIVKRHGEFDGFPVHVSILDRSTRISNPIRESTTLHFTPAMKPSVERLRRKQRHAMTACHWNEIRK